jgi:transposase
LKVHFKPIAEKAQRLGKTKFPLTTHWKKPIVLCQDGATSHTAKVIRSYTKKNAKWLEILQNAPYSPDMAPIEKIWAEVKRQLHEEVHISWREQDEVDAAAKEIWKQLTDDHQYIAKVMNNLLSTCKKVIAKNGGYV